MLKRPFLKEIKNMELSYQLWLYLEKTGEELEFLASRSHISKNRLVAALHNEPLTRREVLKICKAIHLSQKSLELPPLESPSFIPLLDALIRAHRNMDFDSEANKAVATLSMNYPIRELRRNLQWFVYLAYNPGYVESKFDSEPECLENTYTALARNHRTPFPAFKRRSKPVNLDRLARKIDEAEKNK